MIDVSDYKNIRSVKINNNINDNVIYVKCYFNNHQNKIFQNVDTSN